MLWPKNMNSVLVIGGVECYQYICVVYEDGKRGVEREGGLCESFRVMV